MFVGNWNLWDCSVREFDKRVLFWLSTNIEYRRISARLQITERLLVTLLVDFSRTGYCVEPVSVKQRERIKRTVTKRMDRDGKRSTTPNKRKNRTILCGIRAVGRRIDCNIPGNCREHDSRFDTFHSRNRVLIFSQQAVFLWVLFICSAYSMDKALLSARVQ